MKTNKESKRPVKDLKNNIMKHPNVVLTAEGRAGMYPLTYCRKQTLEKLQQVTG